MACDLEVEPFSSYHFSNAWDEGAGAAERLHVHVARHVGARSPIERNFADMYTANWKVSRMRTSRGLPHHVKSIESTPRCAL